MACPKVAGGGDGLQIWRVAVNVLKKQSRTAEKGWSIGLEVRRGRTSSQCKKPVTYVTDVAQGFGLGRFL
jgi:hypothetical protein